MRLAIISDIHSNCYALEAVLNEAERNNMSGFIVLGDIFGYYPWAAETYELLKNISLIKIIKGNHDILILKKKSPTPTPRYWSMAKQNENSLKSKHPEALIWLQNLKLCENFSIGGISYLICHGDPKDPADGRYYPDDENNYDWLPSRNEVIMLGHTHYPFFKRTPSGGIVLNAGSVGQPRDGIPIPSWGIFDCETLSFELKRTEYDTLSTIRLLKELAWDERAILALQKNHSGELEL